MSGIKIIQVGLYLGNVDVDDIILNSLSCLIGYMLFMMCRNIPKRFF